MRILSLNAWGGALFDALAPWVAGCAADVLCLQEVTHTPGAGGWTRFDDADRSLPQRANLLADVRARLPRHHALFTAFDSGPVEDAERRPLRQDFGLASFVAEGYPLTAVRTAFVHGAYRSYVGGWPNDGRPRAALAVRVRDEAGGRFVTVVQVHGLRTPAGKGDTPERRAQAERLAAFVGEVRGEGDLVVVCGDLNLLPDSETFAILAGAGLTDLVGAADTRTSRYAKPVRHAGYLLVSDPSAVAGFEVLSAPEVSDHRILALDV